MSIIAACPCGQRFQARPDLAGKMVKCPKCGQAFQVPHATAAVQPAARQVPQQAAQPFGQAGGPLDDPLGGLDFGSPATGGFQSMPTQTMPGAAYRPAAPALQRPAGGMQRPAAPRPAGKKGSSKTVWILAGVGGGAVVLLLVIFVAVALLLPAVRAARDAARNAQQASVGPNTPGSSSTPGPTGPLINQTAGDTSQWQTLNSTAGGYSIDMPGRPILRTQMTPTPAGPITNYIQSLDKGKFVYMCSHADYPAALVNAQTIDTILDMQAEGATQNLSGTINSKTTISVGGFPGRDVRFSGNMAGRPYQGRSRLVLAGNRMIMALKIGEPGAGSESEDGRFFNSMSISYQPPSSSAADSNLASTSTETTAEPYSPTDAAATNAPSMTPPGMTPPGMTPSSAMPPSNTIPPGPGNFGSSPTATPVSGDLALKQAIYKRIAEYDRLAQEDPRMRMLDKRFPGAAQNIRKVMEHDRDLFLQNLAAQHRMSIEQIKAIEQEGNAAGWPKE